MADFATGSRAFVARWRARITRQAAGDASDMAWAAALAAAPQAVPRLALQRDSLRTPILIVAALHGTLVLALLWRASLVPAPPREITVELVQEPPKSTDRQQAEATPPAPRQPRPAQQPPSTAASAKTVQQARDTARREAAAKRQDARREEAVRQQEARREAAAKREDETKRDEAKQDEAKRDEAKQDEAKQDEAAEQQDKSGPMPAIALPGASGGGTDVVAYPQLVLSQVAKAKKQGRYMGVPGYAGVRFRLAEDGSLEMVKLVSSSGDANLDIEAEAMIRRAAPFPPPPPGGRRDYGITLVFETRP